MKIKRFIGKKVWGYMDFDISFNDGLNFLIGVNGTGKTTVLRLLRGLLMPNLEVLQKIKYDSLFVEYISDVNERIVQVKADNAILSINTSDAQSTTIPLNKRIYENKDKLLRDEFININLVSFLELDRLNNFSDDALREVRTNMFNFVRYYNAQKNKIEENFRKSALTLSKNGVASLAKKLQQLADDDSQKITILKAPITHFVDSTNLFLSEGDKFLKVDDLGEIIINIKDDDKFVSLYDLSSGEKQLIILLGHVAFDNAPVYIIDEPEVSLHLSWQYKFAEALQTANPDAQFILATHAAGIIAKKSNEQYCIDLTPKKND